MTGRRRTAVLGITALVATFSAGAAVGWMARGGSDDATATVEEQVALGAGSVLDDLDLDADQRRRVDSILDRFERWSDSIFAPSRDLLGREATRTHEAILQLLEPDQRARYEAQLDSAGAVLRVRRIRIPR